VVEVGVPNRQAGDRTLSASAHALTLRERSTELRSLVLASVAPRTKAPMRKVDAIVDRRAAAA
jgi:hypothetical protein